MGLKIETKIDTVNKRISGALHGWFTAKANKLVEAGEILVDKAKTNGNYKDDTGDLRRSIGFLVVWDQKIYKEQFSTGPAGEIAKQKALAVAAESKGLVLVVVAGMNYATYVESKGFDVLTSARHIATSLIPQLLK